MSNQNMPLQITLTVINSTQWNAMSNKSERIVISQNSPYEALRLALADAAIPQAEQAVQEQPQKKSDPIWMAGSKLYFALTELLTACHYADQKEELPAEIDGLMMDRATEALAAFDEAEKERANEAK